MNPPAPCEGCPHERRCAAEQLACSAYVKFASNACGAHTGRWNGMEVTRVPSREHYHRLFGEEVA